MNVRKRADGTAPRIMRDRLAVWRQLLERCGRKATRKRVHALRVVTLRLQAELERNVADLPGASHQAQAILRFSKQAEKLRGSLSTVRELDVWIGKLRGLRESHSQTTSYVPRTMHETIRGIDRLEERLKRKRSNAEKKLVATIEKRGRNLVTSSEEVDESLSDYVFGEVAGIAAELVERFRAVRAEFSTFDERNLHEFRKRIKTVRYLAEIHAGEDRKCAQLAAQMKKVQSAIGEWHDWQELGHEARHGHQATTKPLAELIDTLIAESFEKALSIIHDISARIAGAHTTEAEALHLADRKPPMRGDPDTLTHLNKKLA